MLFHRQFHILFFWCAESSVRVFCSINLFMMYRQCRVLGSTMYALNRLRYNIHWMEIPIENAENTEYWTWKCLSLEFTQTNATLKWVCCEEISVSFHKIHSTATEFIQIKLWFLLPHQFVSVRVPNLRSCHNS